LIVLVSAGCKGELPATELPAVGDASDPANAPCAGRERCVTVYLSPWCPVCTQTVPVIQALRRRAAATKHVGVRIIIGGDARPRLEALAQRVGGTVHLDEAGAFARGAGARSVPRWWVTDPRRKVLADFAGGMPGTVPVQLGLMSVLEQLDLTSLAAIAETPPVAPKAPPTPAAPTPLKGHVSADVCRTTKDATTCSACCANVSGTGFVWVRGSGCRCVGP